MEVITAFTREATPVTEHEEILNAISEPVKVERIDGTGARVAEDLPGGRVVIYDIVEYDEVEREEFISDGYEPLNPESPKSPWIPVYRREVHIDRVPRTETYAVRVEDPSESVDEVGAEPAPVLPGSGDDDGGGEVPEFLGESKG